MSTVHTEYGPGRIIAQETVRGRTRFKVAGEGFEVWLDQTKLGGYEPPADGVVDYDAPHWHGHHPDDTTVYPTPYPVDPDDDFSDIIGPDRDRLRRHPDYLSDDDPDARYARRQAGYAEDEMRGLTRGDYEGYDDEYDPRSEYRDLVRDPGLALDDDPEGRYAKRVMRGKAGRPSHLAWAPMDDDNSTTLPYNPEPQHQAIGTPGDDESATIQPIHHIDADERLSPADSVTFDDAEDDDEPGPNPDLFAKEGAFGKEAVPSSILRQYIKKNHPGLYDNVIDKLEKGVDSVLPGQGRALVRGGEGAMDARLVGGPITMADRAISKGIDNLSAGPGWGRLIHPASVHEANPAALVGPALRVLGPMAAESLMGEGGPADHALAASDPGDWGGLIHDAYARPAGLSDKYIDITAGADYHNDPVAQFRHDPDAYINRVGHLMDEGLNPRFAEYMDLVEGDASVRTAAWKDVRAKAMRLKTSGAVHVKDLAPSRIMASVDGDHGTYDVVILKGASFGDQSIANWHCGCEWGKWAFRRKFTYVGRLCSHAYASYLTMQSAAMKEQRPTRRGPSDMIIKRRNPRDRQYPMPVFAAGLQGPSGVGPTVKRHGFTCQDCEPTPGNRSHTRIFNSSAERNQAMRQHDGHDVEPFVLDTGRTGRVRQADNLQNGPTRLTPELVVNDADDAHIFVDVTKDERDDTGPDDVVSDKDIVHFARLMRHCEVTEQPYPRELVAFLARYAGCADDASDDTQADYKAHDADEANEYLEVLREDADRKQEDDFGSMAERVHKIQDAVEEAREHGVAADRFVAMRKTAEPGRGGWTGDGLAWDWTPGWAQSLQNGVRGNGFRTNDEIAQDRSYYRRNYPGKDQGVQGPGIGKNNDGVKGNAPGEGGYTGPAAQEDKPAAAAPAVAPSTAPTVNGPAVSNTPATTVSDQSSANNNGSAGTGNAGGNAGGNGGGNGGGGPYTAPGGGQTSGTVSDGGVAGAENGNNSAITKNMLDADGMYTVQQGDTWTDIAQRTTGDMNNYQKMYDLNKAVAGDNIDSLAAGTKINLKDFATDVGNNGVRGDVTNPAGGGRDNNPATADAGPAVETGLGGLSTANGLAGGAPKVDTSAASDPGTTPATTPPAGDAATEAVKPAEPPPAPAAQPPAPAAPTGKSTEASLRTARDWLRWAAETDGTTSNSTAETPDQPTDAVTTTSPASGSATNSTRSAPATNPAQTQPGSPSADDVYDPANPAQVQQQSMNAANPGVSAGGSNSATSSATSGMSDAGNMGSMIGDIGGAIGGAVGNFLPGIGGAISGIADMAGGLANSFGGGQRAASTLFSSRQDFDEWVRYAYPQDGGEDDDPKTLPHLPFAGSGSPGPLEFSTSEEYADKARKKMDDVTDLGDGDLTQPMGEWQKQGGRGEYEWWNDPSHPMYLHPRDRVESVDELIDEGDDEGPYREASIGYSTDDDSDIVRTFQAHLGETALGAGAGQSAGRFDDIAGAAAGFLRTAGRNYSLAEQSELIREGDKGGARNLDSLDLKGTHYEDMHTLGW